MKKRIVLLCLLAMGLVFSTNGQAIAAKTYEMSISYLSPDTDPLGQGWVFLKKTLEEKSGGRIQVKLYANKMISNSDNENIEKVQANICQMCSVPTSSVSAIANIKEYKVFDYSYLFENDEEVFKVIDGPIGEELGAIVLKRAGIKAVGAYSLGWCAVSTNKQPIKSPADLKGLKIRTMNSDLQMESIRAFSGNPVIVNFGELFTACQQGTVDGIMTTPGLYVSDRFYEVQKYMGVTNAMPLLHIILVNAEWYDSLPDDLKKAYDESIALYQVEVRRLEAEDQEAAYETLRKNGMTVTMYNAEEKKVFMDAAAYITRDMEHIAGKEIIEKVKKALGKN